MDRHEWAVRIWRPRGHTPQKCASYHQRDRSTSSRCPQRLRSFNGSSDLLRTYGPLITRYREKEAIHTHAVELLGDLEICGQMDRRQLVHHWWSEASCEPTAYTWPLRAALCWCRHPRFLWIAKWWPLYHLLPARYLLSVYASSRPHRLLSERALPSKPGSPESHQAISGAEVWPEPLPIHRVLLGLYWGHTHHEASLDELPAPRWWWLGYIVHVWRWHPGCTQTISPLQCVTAIINRKYDSAVSIVGQALLSQSLTSRVSRMVWVLYQAACDRESAGASSHIWSVLRAICPGRKCTPN